jgi:xanthine dehydrogenase YagR molybdenum-binding subunit
MARSKSKFCWNDLPADALRLENGYVTGPDGRMSMAELISQSGRTTLEATGGAALDDVAKQLSRHAFGAQFAEVQVDPDIGTIRIGRWVAAFDGGRVLNAKTAHSQLIGGITFGIGMAPIRIEEVLT